MLLVAVFSVSMSSLAIEVLLTRVFSFAQWNHLSFMVISIVLFGFGASGSVLALLEGRRPGWVATLARGPGIAALIVLFSLSSAGALLFIRSIPLDYFRIPLEPVQLLYLAATYLVLLLPFLCAGAVVSIAFAAAGDRAGWIYAASMAGSALGALLPVLLLPAFGAGRAIYLCAVLPLPAALAGAAVEPMRAGRWRAAVGRAAAVAVVTVLVLLPIWIGGGRFSEVPPSPYKLLAQALQFPGSRVVETASTVRGRIDRLVSPPLRFAPGLSLQFQGRIPERELFVRDGDGLYVLFRLPPGEFARYTHGYAAALLVPGRRRALVVQAGGGMGLPYVVEAGFQAVDLVVDHPWVAAEAARHYGGSAGGAALRLLGSDVRGALARSGERYDLIHLEHWGPSIPGMASLNQEHLLTVEAFTAYVAHLEAQGMLVLSRRLLLPPSDSLKLFAAAFEGLRNNGVEQPLRHLAVLHGFDSFSLLCSAAALGAEDIRALREFCGRLNFDLLYYDGISAGETGIFNRFEEPYHFRQLEALAAALQEGRAEEYYAAHLLDVAPATDDRPFHNRYTRILRLGDLYRATGSRFYLLLMSGETVVLAVLAMALVVGFVLLAVPAVASSTGKGRPSGQPPKEGLLLYFLGTGAGFMLVEMAFIQRFTLLFGDPIVAFTVVLAGLLVASGLGSAVSAGWSAPGLRRSLGLLVSLLAVSALWGDGLLHRLLESRPFWAWWSGGLLLLPFGFLLGVPFPTGLRLWVRPPGRRAYLWAANGTASVIASIVAVPVAMLWGVSSGLWLAAACYCLPLLLSIFVRTGRAT
jgi:hypothetical protein